MNSNIDFLIVGAGFYGVTFARIMTDAGYKCLIIDKRPHIGGNCYTVPGDMGLYDIHIYGPHIFHTSDKLVAQFITNYTKFNSYQQNTIANNNDKLYSLPFNMNTFYSLFKTTNPEAAYNIINLEREDACNIYKDRNDLEAVANKLVGVTIFNNLIKDYTEKQWNKKCSELPGDIIKRLPLRFNFDNNYFNDIFFGIPNEGYTKVFENIINGNAYDQKLHLPITYILNVDYIESIQFWSTLAKNVIYCGAVDELLDYKLGELEWRSLKFKNKQYTYNGRNGQGTAVINYTGPKPKATRSIEHMYFTKERWNQILPNINSFDSVITTEYPDDYKKGKERYYPINNDKNNDLYNQYVELLKHEMPNVQLGGRLGKYKYFDMDDTIKEAINDALQIIEQNKNMKND